MVRPVRTRGTTVVVGPEAGRAGRMHGRTTGPALTLPPAVEDVASSQRVLQQFRIIFNAVKTHFQQLERKVGASGAEVWPLHAIRQQPGIGIGALAQALNIRQPTASILVKSLARQGLIVAERLESDRRAVALRVLPKGSALLRRVPGPYEGVLPNALKALDRETLVVLQGALDELIAQLGGDDRAGAIPLSQIRSDR